MQHFRAITVCAGEVVMKPFVLSALFSFAIYEFMAYLEIPPRRGWFRIGGINVNFSPTSAVWAHRALIALMLLTILIAALFVHERLFPMDAISRDKTNIVLGFLFGPLFAIWLNSVFNHPPGTPLSRGLVLGGLGLILFCLIGSAGNQTGKLIQQLTRKISGFNKPSKANEDAFNTAVDQIAAISKILLRSLETNAPAKNRQEEAIKMRIRSAQRFAR